MRLKVLLGLFVAAIALMGVSIATAQQFKGTAGDDTIIGTQDADVIASLAGNDTIDAEGGDDKVYAGAGNDRALGGGGNDLVRGGAGADDLNGGAGNDIVRGRADNDVVSGGEGNDRLWPGKGEDIQYGGDGNDRLHALANDNQQDILDCGAGRDVAIINAREPHDLAAANCEVVRRVVPTAKEAASDD
jgi:Ca2+-binding RTX toxin-like protein